MGDDDPKPHLTKEEAIDACLEHHYALIKCFKTCTFISSFSGCCLKEHKVFWECYTAHRGSNETALKAWLTSGRAPKIETGGK